MQSKMVMIRHAHSHHHHHYYYCYICPYSDMSASQRPVEVSEEYTRLHTKGAGQYC